MVSGEKSDIIHILILLWVKCSFSLASFKMFSLSLIFCSLNMICRGVLVFILPPVVCDSWICGLVYVIDFGKVSAVMTLNISSVPSSLSFLPGSSVTLRYTFCSGLIFCGYSISFFSILFSPCILVF